MPARPASSTPATTATAPQHGPAVEKGEEKDAGAAAGDFSVERDPFMLAPVSKGPASEVSDLVLEGISSDGKGKAMAIISGSIVRSGGKIGKFTVVNILKTKVIVTDGKKEYTLTLK